MAIDPNTMILIIDRALSLVTIAMNAVGPGTPAKRVSDIIAACVAEGREWTDAEKAEIQALLTSERHKSAAQFGLDPETGEKLAPDA